MSSSNAGRGVSLRAALLLAAALTIAIAVALGNVAEAPASGTHAVAAKKKCKKRGKKSAVAAKKCKKAKAPAPVVQAPPPPPTPLPLTDAEVINRVIQKAEVYCLVDPDCFDYGYWGFPDAAHADCSSKSTYSWTCYGWNDEDYEPDGTFDETCDFREVVNRSGYSGITSQQDLSFGASGWNCVAWPGPGH